MIMGYNYGRRFRYVCNTLTKTQKGAKNVGDISFDFKNNQGFDLHKPIIRSQKKRALTGMNKDR